MGESRCRKSRWSVFDHRVHLWPGFKTKCFMLTQVTVLFPYLGTIKENVRASWRPELAQQDPASRAAQSWGKVSHVGPPAAFISFAMTWVTSFTGIQRGYTKKDKAVSFQGIKCKHRISVNFWKSVSYELQKGVGICTSVWGSLPSFIFAEEQVIERLGTSCAYEAVTVFWPKLIYEQGLCKIYILRLWAKGLSMMSLLPL